jgi:hypothetical protein
MVLSFIKQGIRKEEDMIAYSIYKNNHPVTPPQVVNVVDLGSRYGKRLSRSTIRIAIQKEKKP